MNADARTGIGFDIDHTIAIDNKLERVAFLRLLEIVIDDGGYALGSLDDETRRIDELLVAQRSGQTVELSTRSKDGLTSMTAQAGLQ